MGKLKAKNILSRTQPKYDIVNIIKKKCIEKELTVRSIPSAFRKPPRVRGKLVVY